MLQYIISNDKKQLNAASDPGRQLSESAITISEKEISSV
jgi:hypothetical protein